ncbi:MAG: acyl-CoA thioesterase FadM [Bacteriovoracaceae bacterium]|jgi:acyl-CoA thioesterase FadM
MARVKIKFPEKTHFSTDYLVSVSDLNFGNHVGNDRFLGLCHEARVRFFKSLGQDELNFYESSLIMADAELSYKAQSFHGDNLKIEISVLENSKNSFDLLYRIKNQNNDLVLLAKTAMVYFDYKNNKIDSCPESWAKELAQLR